MKFDKEYSTQYVREMKYLLNNGRQHYMPVDYFGGKVSLQHQQQNDNIKREFCKNNNINLIEIPFTYNTKEKIEEIIMSKL